MAAADNALARSLGVSPAVVLSLRVGLTEATHFIRHGGGKVDYTEAGIEAIRTALNLSAKKKEGAAPGAQPVACLPVLLPIARVYPNVRVVQVRTPEGLLVEVRVRDNRAMRRNLKILCVRLPDGRWQCNQHGQGVPLKPLTPPLEPTPENHNTTQHNIMGKHIIILALTGTFNPGLASDLANLASSQGLSVRHAAAHYDGQTRMAIGTAPELSAETIAALSGEKPASEGSAPVDVELLSKTHENTVRIISMLDLLPAAKGKKKEAAPKPPTGPEGIDGPIGHEGTDGPIGPDGGDTPPTDKPNEDKSPPADEQQQESNAGDEQQQEGNAAAE